MSDQDLVAELRELVSQQQDRANQYETFNDNHMEGLSKGYQQCANQLQEIIDRYE
jgi:hypothetical protein